MQAAIEEADLDLDEAFSPVMLAEARAQMASAGAAMAKSSVVPATGTAAP